MLVRPLGPASIYFYGLNLLEHIFILAFIGFLIFIIGKGISNDDVIDHRDRHKPRKTPRKYREPAKKVTPIRAQTPQLQGALTLPPIPDNMTIKGKAYIIDGDTIRIGSTKIRLAGIDAPEEDQPWGRKSKWALLEICRGQIITADLNGTRSYDRLVATCYLPDGRDIGTEIVKRGLALDLPEFSHGKYRPYEPEGARRRLANGAFGHKSLRHKHRKT